MSVPEISSHQYEGKKTILITTRGKEVNFYKQMWKFINISLVVCNFGTKITTFECQCLISV